MELIIIRHAVAEEREDFARKGLEDHFRPLTIKGRKRMQKVCVRLQSFIEDFDLIVSSPLVRAKQTAEIVSRLYAATKVVEAPELMPQSPPQAFVKWLRTQARAHRRIAVIGHEPHLSALACYLLAGKVDSFIDLRKSGVLALEIESFADLESGSAQLLFAIPPKFLAD